MISFHSCITRREYLINSLVKELRGIRKASKLHKKVTCKQRRLLFEVLTSCDKERARSRSGLLVQWDWNGFVFGDIGKIYKFKRVRQYRWLVTGHSQVSTDPSGTNLALAESRGISLSPLSFSIYLLVPHSLVSLTEKILWWMESVFRGSAVKVAVHSAQTERIRLLSHWTNVKERDWKCTRSDQYSE